MQISIKLNKIIILSEVIFGITPIAHRSTFAHLFHFPPSESINVCDIPAQKYFISNVQLFVIWSVQMSFTERAVQMWHAEMSFPIIRKLGTNFPHFVSHVFPFVLCQDVLWDVKKVLISYILGVP